ncbi:dihydrolipoyl dehydrogenase [Pacificimonas flava]|uniref:Dihydrolipoyl dehydrogenase n=1 Tax=Pacificimonas flava TaxID=1234595 RepID=M2U818_9SPHN|nr:dihydrolipoyl dehydrogenase [Pacificimonas flava]EMD84133.1 Dihydrolipoamide dehydrogenase [Pacificimonas flava]MBB5279990.1 dihydrolipoamide dehydrogenase [Pacificimonas flava]
MTDHSCKLLVIGAGPGGYIAAIRAGQLGIDTIIVERAAPGGTCLNIGCIPSKALIHAAEEFEKARAFADGNPLGISAGAPKLDLSKTVAWKDGIVKTLTTGVSGLLKKAKVKRIEGTAKFLDGKTVRVEGPDGPATIRAENVCIATGSQPVELPFLPFGGDVISSTEALSLSEPPKTLAVIGAGYIGLELGIAFAKLGSKVTIVEMADHVLPLYDKDLTKPVAKHMESLGIDVHLGARAKERVETGVTVETSDGETLTVEADKILVTVGRSPVTESWGREMLVLDMEGRFIRIDDECRTSMNGIFAIGDVTGEPMLAHRAMAQGEMVAEIVADHRRSWDKRAIPAVCFTDPEIVSVGLSPEEARAEGIEIETNLFPFAANGRALTMESSDGFVRAVARKDNHLLVGLQAVGKGVAELSAAFGLALEMGARLEDVAGTIHAHPTQGEAFQEAALRTLGHALHI